MVSGTDSKIITADLLLTDAIQDSAEELSLDIAAARDKALESPYYEVLYDFDTLLWTEGPDFLAELIYG